MIRQSTMLRLLIVCTIIGMSGCRQESSTPLQPVQSSLLTYQPKGTISGLIKNRITDVPVGGALVTLGFDGGVFSTVSNDMGAFSFADVPVGQYQIVNGTSVLSGTYTLNVNLGGYNSGQTNVNKKYRENYYSTVLIKFTSLAPGDSLAVSDMVGTILLQIAYLNTTVTGQVVDVNMQPVAGAIVSLFDATVAPNIALAQALTSASGVFSFANIDNGLTVTIKARSADGSLEGTLANFTLPANITSDSLRSQFTTERLLISSVDNVNPFVTAITPENNSDVAPAGLQIIYKFSEPIKQTAYTRTDLPLGHTTILDDITITYTGLKKAATAVNFTAQWNAAFTQLTLIPQGIVGAAKYSVSTAVAFNSGKVTDNANRVITNNNAVTGDFEALLFTTNGSSTVPGAPALSRRIVSGFFGDLDYSGGSVGLEWNSDPNARSYNIYKSVNGGSFELLQADYFGQQYTDAVTSLVIPAGANNPLKSGSVQYVVRAESKDLVESPASNIVTVNDATKPRFLSGSAAAAGVNTWVYTLRFSEPLTIAGAENTANYLFSNTNTVVYTVNAASYLGFSAGQYLVQLVVTTNAAPIAGYVITVVNVLDLSGLGMDPNANNRTF